MLRSSWSTRYCLVLIFSLVHSIAVCYTLGY
jgi:hypothetical protein